MTTTLDELTAALLQLSRERDRLTQDVHRELEELKEILNAR